MELVKYEDRHFKGVAQLWQEVFPNDPPWNNPSVAIPAKLQVQPELFVVAVEGADVIGTIVAGYDGKRGWLHDVAVRPSHQRRGVATALVARAERLLAELGCIKVNLQVRATNDQVVAFYKKIGYATEERVSMGKLLGKFA